MGKEKNPGRSKKSPLVLNENTRRMLGQVDGFNTPGPARDAKGFIPPKGHKKKKAKK